MGKVGVAERDGSGERGLLHRFLWKVKLEQRQNEGTDTLCTQRGSTRRRQSHPPSLYRWGTLSACTPAAMSGFQSRRFRMNIASPVTHCCLPEAPVLHIVWKEIQAWSQGCALFGTGMQRGGTDDAGLGTGEVLIPLGEMGMFDPGSLGWTCMFSAILVTLHSEEEMKVQD